MKNIFRGLACIFLTIIILSGCGGGDYTPPDVIVNPNPSEAYPSKYNDPEYASYTYFNRQTITFTFVDGEVPENETCDLKFHIIPDDTFNEANNNVYSTYYASVNGFPAEIPRPVGYLNYYSKTVTSDTKSVSLEYTSSDVSGVYKIIMDAYHDGDLLFSKEASISVKIPYLISLARTRYGYVYYTDSSGNLTYDYRKISVIVGQTDYHSENNYLQSVVETNLDYLCNYFVANMYNATGEWYIMRLNDMSLPWGGLFWIGYKSSKDVTYTRKDGNGKEYTIKYGANMDNRIFCPPHVTHRQGRNIDLGFYSADAYGNYDTTKYISLTDLRNEATYWNFSVLMEGDHYHLTYQGTIARTYLGSPNY